MLLLSNAAAFDKAGRYAMLGMIVGWVIGFALMIWFAVWRNRSRVRNQSDPSRLSEPRDLAPSPRKQRLNRFLASVLPQLIMAAFAVIGLLVGHSLGSH